ncbi:unnamed protein product [Ectocarpus sp. CCAP 1310/34]|nr:unnamed protein product [Ectocarpus sp. CCAP 1310/34]
MDVTPANPLGQWISWALRSCGSIRPAREDTLPTWDSMAEYDEAGHTMRPSRVLSSVFQSMAEEDPAASRTFYSTSSPSATSVPRSTSASARAAAAAFVAASASAAASASGIGVSRSVTIGATSPPSMSATVNPTAASGHGGVDQARNIEAGVDNVVNKAIDEAEERKAGSIVDTKNEIDDNGEHDEDEGNVATY